jgi:hypothetical protein
MMRRYDVLACGAGRSAAATVLSAAPVGLPTAARRVCHSGFAGIAATVLGLTDWGGPHRADSGLGPGSQDVVEQNVAEGELSRIADQVET